MKTKTFLALLLSFCIFLPALAQTRPAAPPQPQKPSDDKDDDVVRITTNLVQVDAVVTKDGKIVPDLTADDFEIFEDGKKQTITSFAYISNVQNTTANTTSDKSASVVPFTPFKRDEPHRTIAFVVDDLGLSAESIHQVRRQLRKFVAEELQPNDLVAVIRTGGELGALQQFTTDKRLLNRAVDQLRWNFCSRLGISVFTSLGTPYPTHCGPGTLLYSQSYNNTLKALRFIIDAMGRLPGRKSLVFMSDDAPGDTPVEINRGRGVRKTESITENESAPLRPSVLNSTPIDDSPLESYYGSYTEKLNRISERAVRASVVIYSIDTRGLAVTGITAADSIRGNPGMITQQIESTLAMRSHLLLRGREGAELLARQTGGFQIRNSNSFQFDRIMEDQSGYYLLGYRPTEETFNRRFHHIKAKVKRSGMSVRTRYGFFGVTEEEVKRGQLTQGDLTNLALSSPFSAQDVEVDLTTFFADKQGDNAIVRSFVYLGLKDLTFTMVNGRRHASIEIHGVIFGDNGSIVQQLKRGGTLHFSDSEYQDALQNGFGLSIDMPVKRPGSYQVRVAVRDRTSSKMGSAGAFVDVPNLKKKNLAVSGIVLGRVPQSGPQTDAAAQPVTNPGTRRFKTNSDLYFAYQIYNAANEGGAQLRNMVMEAKLFRDGKTVYSSPEAPIVAGDQKDLNQVVANGVVPLSPSLEPGSYYLQVMVTEKGTKNKAVPVVQWIDFEIVK